MSEPVESLMNSEPLIEGIKTYRPRNGDVLILRSAKRLSVEEYERLRHVLAKIFPSNKTAILEPGFTLEVVSTED